MPENALATESAQLAAFMGTLTGHGLEPKPTGLLVTGENGKTAIIMCHARPDDGDRMWFCVAGGPWLAEADNHVFAITALKTHLSEGTPGV